MKKNWKVLAVALTIILASLVSALDPQDLLSPQQLQDTIQSLLTKLSFLAGGIFGLYVILLLVRMYYERKKVKLLEDIRNDVDKLTIHFGIKHAHPRENILKRIFGFLWADEEASKRSKK